MFSKLVMAIALTVLVSGCAPFKRLSYITPAPSATEPAIDVSLLNSQVTLAVTQQQLSLANKQLINTLIRSGGNSYKQHVLVNAAPATLRQHRQALTDALIGAGIVSSQLRLVATDDMEPTHVTLTTEYFVATAPGCQQGFNIVLGCATARNKAISVSSPVQLIRGKRLGPADGVRQVKAIETYQNPPTPPAANATLSKVGR